MAQRITSHFEDYLADRISNGETVVLDKFIFAYIEGLDPDAPIPPDVDIPDPDDIQGIFDVTRDGLIASNTVVYSVLLGTDIGTWKFNWIGLIDDETQTLAMVATFPEQNKIASDPSSGVMGNNYIRNFVMRYAEAAEHAEIDTPAESWQIDFSKTLNAEMERVRKHAELLASRHAFVGDGWKVSGLTSDSNGVIVEPGEAMVRGLHAVNESPLAVSLDSQALPQNIYLVTSYQGELTGEWKTTTQVVITDQTLAEDWFDGGFMHYSSLLSVASSDGDGGVILSDKRVTEWRENHLDQNTDPHPQYAKKQHEHEWGEVNNKPAQATRWPTHDEVTDKPEQATRWPTHDEVTDKPEQATRWPTHDEVTDKPTTYPPGEHPHKMVDISDLSPETIVRTSGAQSIGGQKEWSGTQVYNGPSFLNASSVSNVQLRGSDEGNAHLVFTNEDGTEHRVLMFVSPSGQLTLRTSESDVQRPFVFGEDGRLTLPSAANSNNHAVRYSQVVRLTGDQDIDGQKNFTEQFTRFATSMSSNHGGIVLSGHRGTDSNVIGEIIFENRSGAENEYSLTCTGVGVLAYDGGTFLLGEDVGTAVRHLTLQNGNTNLAGLHLEADGDSITIGGGTNGNDGTVKVRPRGRSQSSQETQFMGNGRIVSQGNCINDNDLVHKAYADSRSQWEHLWGSGNYTGVLGSDTNMYNIDNGTWEGWDEYHFVLRGDNGAGPMVNVVVGRESFMLADDAGAGKDNCEVQIYAGTSNAFGITLPGGVSAQSFRYVRNATDGQTRLVRVYGRMRR